SRVMEATVRRRVGERRRFRRTVVFSCRGEKRGKDCATGKNGVLSEGRLLTERIESALKRRAGRRGKTALERKRKEDCDAAAQTLERVRKRGGSATINATSGAAKSVSK
ncbi:MAG: hypothetical protein IKY61_08805, partial [Thermoguttaceae bacterium]|nr:hypothetical protein [Thermoguttaceae bacterium]